MKAGISMRLSLTGILLGIVSLSGCASLNHAGTASYSVKPFMAGDRAICCEVSIHNGKEFALLDATVTKRGDDYTVRLHEEGVAAFKGQHLAAGAARDAAAAGAAVLLAPVAVPAIGAAAAGAGAGVLINQAGQD